MATPNDHATQLFESGLSQVEAALSKTNLSIQQLQQNLQNAINNKIGLEAQKSMLTELQSKHATILVKTAPPVLLPSAN